MTTPRTTLVTLAGIALLSACDQQEKPPPDAGVDTSCGIDCDAQARYGLILNRCFEYVTSNDEVMGAFVSETRELEGGIPVIAVDYYDGSGIWRMTDSFTIVSGSLKLVRREWKSGAGGSVTYKDEANAIVGATWWEPSTTSGQSIVSEVVADVVVGTRTADPTTYTVVTTEPTSAEKTVPAGTFDNSVKMLFNLQSGASQGPDARRVFAENTGFTTISTSFSATSTDYVTYRLQAIRDIGTADGGNHPCGSPAP